MKMTTKMLSGALLLTALVTVNGAHAQRGTPGAAKHKAHAAHQGQGLLLPKIESRLGRPLSVEQRKQLGAAAQETMASLRAAQGRFVQSVAQVSGLSPSDIAAMMPTIGQANEGFDKNMIPKIEAKLGRPLTPQQLQAINKADSDKKAAMGPVQQNFARSIARITGLPYAEVLAMLPRIGL